MHGRITWIDPLEAGRSGRVEMHRRMTWIDPPETADPGE
jgi:hypothetical protein